MKKFFSILMALSILFSLCACGNEAASTEPATESTTVPTTVVTEPATTVPAHDCAVDGHSWVEATCESAKFCAFCGETEGEALGHTWVDANYQSAKLCTTCGFTEGEPLTATFDEHGMVINITEVGKEYDYVTTCSEDSSKKTVGKLMISDYRVFEGDEAHPAMEGYEWHAVTVTIRFNDENAWNYGMGVRVSCDNYYDLITWDATQTKIASGTYSQTCNFNGVDYECVADFSGKMSFSEWVDKEKTCTFDRYVRVPVGYDGVVLTFRDNALKMGDGQHLYDVVDENSLYFRLDGNGAK